MQSPMGVQSSYWRHAFIASAVFAALLSWDGGGFLLVTFAAELALTMFAVIPHARRREAKGFHRAVRSALAWIATIVMGLNITALAIGIPILLLMGRFEWNTLVVGLLSLGYLIFTTHLLKTAADTPRSLTSLDLKPPDNTKLILLQLPITLKGLGYSDAEIHAVLSHPDIQGVASLAETIAPYPYALDNAQTRQLARQLVDVYIGALKTVDTQAPS